MWSAPELNTLSIFIRQSITGPVALDILEDMEALGQIEGNEAVQFLREIVNEWKESPSFHLDFPRLAGKAIFSINTVFQLVAKMREIWDSPDNPLYNDWNDANKVLEAIGYKRKVEGIGGHVYTLTNGDRVFVNFEGSGIVELNPFTSVPPV